MSASTPDPVSSRLADIAADIAASAGLGALTARALAAQSGASPSAVNYHFGGRDGLLVEVHRTLALRREAWRARRLATLEGGPVWAFVLAGVFDLAFPGRGETLALLEFETLGDEPAGLAERVRAEHASQDAFWLQAAMRLGATEAQADVWANLARTLTRFAILDEEPGAALAWLAPALVRAAERMAGHATPAATPWLAVAEPPGSLPARPAGAQRLVGAALQIIGRQGLHAVTLRNVAEAAGLSLASTTYFFETKADIVLAAFAQLRDGISVRALGAGRQGAAGFSQALLSEQGEMRWEIGAMFALFLAGARNPDLRAVALSLRRLSGQTSAAWLAEYGSPDVDRLDAFVWSTYGMGVQERLTHLPPDARRAEMDASVARAGDALFRLQAPGFAEARDP